ncbi:hypothetical protein C1646_761258 [Rhizophagus diaphanus]|nr:hypothetical protein C1646_761258 [Rhizophagus diaphanus] [Rhizophagus sp. MUCL 43196]
MPKRKYVTRSVTKNKESQVSNNDQESPDKPKKLKFTKSDIKELDDDQETISTSSKTITAEEKPQSSSKSSKSPSKYIKTYKQNEKTSSTTPILESSDEQRSGTTPILPSDQRSRKTTPAIDNNDNDRRSRSTSSVDNLAIDDSHKLPAYTSNDKILKNYEKILIKQVNQIRALYDIQKATNEKVTWIQNQIKVKNNRQKNIDLSEKDGYNFVCAAFFPDNMWPTFENFKNSLEGWLEKNHTNYIKELGQRDWINNFSGKHYSMLLRRMKDLRGIGVSAVKNAISKEFNLSVVGGNKRKNLKAISDWKKSKQVEDCYYKLYDDEAAIDNIAKRAFPSTTDELMLHHNYVYTAAVADIILNPNYPGIEVSKGPLEKRYKKFKELLENKGSFELSDANAILEKEKETPEFIKKKRIIDDEEEEEVEVEVKVEEAPGNDDYFDFLFASDW